MRQTWESYAFPQTGMTPILVLRNRYLGGNRFRPELMIRGDDGPFLGTTKETAGR